MIEREWRFTDKSKWGDGPWQQEPDKKQWTDAATGFPCLIVRGPHGALCGYVGVTLSHPFFGKSYNDVDVEVHGGLTFADRCQPNREHGICHIVEQGENENVWWFGFDCAHSGDVSPWLLLKGLRNFGETYHDVAYVTRAITRLAKQLKEGRLAPRSRG